MSRVFAVQENPHLDYSDAQRYGDVEFMTALEFSCMPNSLRNDTVITDIEKSVRRFNPHTDYLLMTGNPITLGFAFSLVRNAAQRVGMPLKILRWDGQQHSYRGVEFKY